MLAFITNGLFFRLVFLSLCSCSIGFVQLFKEFFPFCINFTEDFHLKNVHLVQSLMFTYERKSFRSFHFRRTKNWLGFCFWSSWFHALHSNDQKNVQHCCCCLFFHFYHNFQLPILSYALIKQWEAYHGIYLLAICFFLKNLKLIIIRIALEQNWEKNRMWLAT